MKPICVIDNSTLVNLTKLEHLQVFKHLKRLLSKIHVPEMTLVEYRRMLVYEPNRKRAIDQIDLNTFLGFCPAVDTIHFNFLKLIKGIDAGEAEAVAQLKLLHSNLVLSDDQNFVKALENSDRHVRVMGTVHLIAWLDLDGIIEDPTNYFKSLYKHIQFTSAQLRAAYKTIANELGISIPKKDLNKRTSIKAWKTA